MQPCTLHHKFMHACNLLYAGTTTVLGSDLIVVWWAWPACVTRLLGGCGSRQVKIRRGGFGGFWARGDWSMGGRKVWCHVVYLLR